MIKLIIWGAKGQAIVLEELLSSVNVQIEVFFDNDNTIPSPVKSIPVYYGEAGFAKWVTTIQDISSFYFLVAIGGNNGYTRHRIAETLKAAGLLPYTAIHPTAFVANNAIIGEGSQILATSSICARVKIGKNCIINTAASVDHECVIGDNVHIGPGAKLAGCVIVGDNVFIGTNATILPHIKIGKNAVIGAGAVVLKDVSANIVVVGNPAKKLKTL
jgi:sugar O-acyltransferase (sialic acid O-acetyltransferase NeuD family)